MADIPRKSTLKKVLLVTIIFSFSVLLLGGFYIFKSMAPRPDRVVSEDGQTLFTRDQIIGGQAIYEKYGLMDYGSVLGHGSYLGPDYTAESLHVYINAMHQYYAKKKFIKILLISRMASKPTLKTRSFTRSAKTVMMNKQKL